MNTTDLEITVARLYRGHLYPSIRNRRGATALLDLLTDVALHSVTTDTTTHEHGFKMRSRDEFEVAVYEHSFAEAFEDAVDQNDTVFDIGAYHGFYSLLAATLTDETVFAFEPNRQNRQVLSETIALNDHIENIDIVETAVLDKTEQVQYDPSDVRTTVGMGGENVYATTVDQFCADHGVTPDVIKIDVEGAESKVLTGAVETLESRPTCFIEVHNNPRRKFEQSVTETLASFETEVLMRRESETFLMAR